MNEDKTADQLMASSLETVVAFLMGEGELDGCHFGEKQPWHKGKFWWREHIRQLQTNQPNATSVYVRDAERWRQFVEMIDPDKVPGGFTVYYAMEKGTDQLCYFDCVTEIVDAAIASHGRSIDDRQG